MNLNQPTWALVTGASSGIGEALARNCAARGMSVVLVARDQERLRLLAQKIEAEFKVNTLVLAKNLGLRSSTQEILETLVSQNIRVDVLINNAGFGLKGAFVETSVLQELEMVQLHIGAFLTLTKSIVAEMKKRGHGRVLNVSSVYSYSSVPFQSVYAATKAFMLSFSESLNNELQGSGVTVTTLCPGITQTRFRSRAGMKDKKFLSMTPERVAHLGMCGLVKQKRVVVPGLVNKLFVVLSRYLPDGIRIATVRLVNQLRGVNPS